MPSLSLLFSEVVEDEGSVLFPGACAINLEGIVRSGRTGPTDGVDHYVAEYQVPG
jgi:hypothetical protein